MEYTNPILFYDGSCGFCQRSVQFVLQHEQSEVMHFTPLQSDLATQIKKKYPELQKIDSIVLLKGKELLVESDAAIALASYLRAPYHLLKYTQFVPKVFRDSVYRVIAKNRHRLLRNNESCLVPTAQQRKRFLS